MGKNIYVVEDNDDIRELVQYLLESEDYNVKGFANVTDFEKHFLQEKPDMMVLDVMLPDGNGMDVCNKIKANDLTKDIPVLLMSANTNVSYISKKSLADDFIAKPFDIDDLISRVYKLLS
ncbi:MAG: response regulator [Pedobacter sp.]|nr:MAG: response regulator [Pedobacter sp.]